MLKKCSIRELGDDPVGGLHQRLVLERDEVHREPGAHRLARLRVAEHDALAVRDAVDRALAAGRELHHEQVGPALVGQQLDRLLEPHRDRARPLVQQLVRAVDGRVEDAEAARAGREDRLEADGAVGIAELARRRADLAPRRCTRRKSGPRTPSRCSSAYVSALSFERRIVSGRRDEHRHREAVAMRGEPVEVERRLRQHGVHALALDDVEHRVGEARVRARRHEVERVAEVAADGALAHVGADEPDLALAVLAQRAQQRRRARRARRRRRGP